MSFGLSFGLDYGSDLGTDLDLDVPAGSCAMSARYSTYLGSFWPMVSSHLLNDPNSILKISRTIFFWTNGFRGLKDTNKHYFHCERPKSKSLFRFRGEPPFMIYVFTGYFLHTTHAC